MSDQEPYVLGTGEDELERLGLQHQLWSDAAHRAWRKARVGPGQRVLDVGCGPGYATFDLAQLVMRHGAVVAVDESRTFLESVENQARTRNLPQVRTRLGDVQSLGRALDGLPPFDLAFARWVMCFVPDPEAVVRGVAEHLRPGGRFVVHDYFNYRAMTVAPSLPAHDLAVAATADAWGEQGGDVDVMGSLPSRLAANGFAIEHITCHQRVATGGDTMYAWFDTWWHVFAPKLVAMGRLPQADCDDLLAEIEARRGNPHAIVHLPPVYEIIARREERD